MRLPSLKFIRMMDVEGKKKKEPKERRKLKSMSLSLVETFQIHFNLDQNEKEHRIYSHFS